MAAEGYDARHMRRIAAHDARRIAREHTPSSDSFALLVRAALAHLDGDASLAVDRLTGAAAAFDRAGMQLFAAVARRRLGALMGAARGGAMIRQADDWMAAQQVRNPAAMTRLLAPGFRD
jgi:hypothetical protein